MNSENDNLEQKAALKPKIKRSSVLKVSITLLVVVLAGATIFLAYKNNQLKKQLLPKPSPLDKSIIDIFREWRKEIANKKWQSPSGKKYITYKYSTDSDEYQLYLFDKERELRIGRLNEPVADLEVTWSPDETYVVVSKIDDLTRMFCINLDNRECRGKVVFYTLDGNVSIFWSNNQTAYIRYGDRGNDIVSKLSFSDAIYPKELIIYEKPWNDFFAYSPVSISPNNTYLVMEHRYEGPPNLAIMNTQTGKIVTPRKNDELYMLGSSPNYNWNGNLLTFTGGLTTGGSWLELADETFSIDDSLLGEITLDASLIN